MIHLRPIGGEDDGVDIRIDVGLREDGQAGYGVEIAGAAGILIAACPGSEARELIETIGVLAMHANRLIVTHRTDERILRREPRTVH